MCWLGVFPAVRRLCAARLATLRDGPGRPTGDPSANLETLVVLPSRHRTLELFWVMMTHISTGLLFYPSMYGWCPVDVRLVYS